MATNHRPAASWLISILFFAALILTAGSVRVAKAEDEEKNAALEEATDWALPGVDGLVGTSEAGAAFAVSAAQPATEPTEAEIDPWEGFNEPMFRFNHDVFDRFLLKPVATVWNAVLPDVVQRSLRNGLDNLLVVRRVVNNLLQGKMERAGRELVRFTINTTAGAGGLVDVAKETFGLQQADEDFGQTLGVWGVKPGPYLVLPFFPPLTVRDGVGWGVDVAMDPLTYALPFGANAGILGVTAINDRSLNLDRYERVEEGVVDLYSAVRDAYLQRRAAAIRE